MITTEERIEKLERRCASECRHRWLLGAIGLCLGIGFGWAAFTQDTAQAREGSRSEFGRAAAREIRVTRLVIEDEQGRVRGSFGVNKNVPGLALFDEASKSRIQWTASKRGPEMPVFDARGKARFMLAESARTPDVVPLGQTGKPRIALGRSGRTLMARLYGPDGRVLWEAP